MLEKRGGGRGNNKCHTDLPRQACSEEEEARKPSRLPGQVGRLGVQKVAVSV